MSIPTTYSALQAKVVDLLKRTGDATIEALASDWIGYAESEMQTRIKLLEFESSASVTITAGVGTLPTDYVGMRAAYWSDSPNRELTYVTPEQFDILNDGSSDHYAYTITGSSIKLPTTESGTVVLTYLARFTPLSNSNTSNAILASYPDLYLYGAAKHGCVWIEDDAGVQKYGTMFNASCDRVNDNNAQRKYGHSLAVRTR